MRKLAIRCLRLKHLKEAPKECYRTKATVLPSFAAPLLYLLYLRVPDSDGSATLK